MSTATPPPGTTGGYSAGSGDGYPASPQGAPPGPPTEPDVESASVGELIGQITRDLSTLIRQELALAQAELRQEATKTGKAAGAFGAAGAAAFLVVLFLSVALWAALSNVMDGSWAGLLVAALWALIAAALFRTGRAKLREVRPVPDRTVDTLGSVPDAMSGRRGGTR